VQKVCPAGYFPKWGTCFNDNYQETAKVCPAGSVEYKGKCYKYIEYATPIKEYYCSNSNYYYDENSNLCIHKRIGGRLATCSLPFNVLQNGKCYLGIDAEYKCK
jgi:hypothetical protein